MNDDLHRVLEALVTMSSERPMTHGYTATHVARKLGERSAIATTSLEDLKELKYVRSHKTSSANFGSIVRYQATLRGKNLINGSKAVEPTIVTLNHDSYINPDLIKEFANKKDAFNYKKLVGLLNELNDNYKKGNVYSCSQLLKGLVNHIPPLLGEFTAFEVAVSQYSWEKGVRPYITEIVKYIDEANDITHTIISNRQDQATLTSLPKAMYVNTLLSVCLAESSSQKPIYRQGNAKNETNKKKTTNDSQTSIEIKDNIFKWANWGGRFGSGFMGSITFNNFVNPKNNFITKATISYLRSDNTKWTSTTFKVGDNNYEAKVKIGANDMLESQLWLSDGVRTDQGMMQEALDGKGELEIAFADGSTCNAQVLVSNNH